MYKTITLFLISLPWAAHAVSVDNWLDKMNQAMSQQNYQGTMVIRQGDKLQAIKVTQGVSASGSWQTLESQTGEPRIILRKNTEVTTIYPAKKTVTHSTVMGDERHKGALHSLPKNREKLNQFYSFELAGEERVANKLTQVLHMTPRDKFRYGYTFWLDKQSGLLLKCDLKSNKGKVLEQLMYSDIELLSSAPENHVQASAVASFKQVTLSNQNDIEKINWHAGKIPEGFTLIHSMKTTQAKANYHMVFSDGLASVSVFIEQAGSAQKKLLGQSSMGLVNAFSAVNDDVYITAIGEVPALTVRMIAQSIHPVD